MGVSSHTSKWNRLNHDWSGKPDDGYAVCWNCDCREDSNEAADICWEGPVIKRLRGVIRSGLAREVERIPQWMKDIMEPTDADE